jgi:hypothetical protein
MQLSKQHDQRVVPMLSHACVAGTLMRLTYMAEHGDGVLRRRVVRYINARQAATLARGQDGGNVSRPIVQRRQTYLSHFHSGDAGCELVPLVFASPAHTLDRTEK